MELNKNLLNLNNRNFGSVEKFRLVENRLYAGTHRSKIRNNIPLIDCYAILPLTTSITANVSKITLTESS
jgi:hypothetical protein